MLQSRRSAAAFETPVQLPEEKPLKVAATFNRHLPVFTPEKGRRDGWDVVRFFSLFESSLEWEGIAKEDWLPQLRAQAREPESLARVDAAIATAKEKGLQGASLYQAVKDAFHNEDPSRYSAYAYLRALLKLMAPDSPGEPFVDYCNAPLEVDAWLQAYEEARQREIRRYGNTPWPGMGIDLFRLLYIMCRTPVSVRKQIDVTDVLLYRHDSTFAAHQLYALLGQSKDVLAKLEPEKWGNVPSFSFGGADAYLRYAKQMLEFGRKLRQGQSDAVATTRQGGATIVGGVQIEASAKLPLATAVVSQGGKMSRHQRKGDTRFASGEQQKRGAPPRSSFKKRQQKKKRW